MKKPLKILRDWALAHNFHLLALLLNSWQLSAAFCLVISCIVLTPLTCWKVIPVTPEGVTPRFKVSLLDLAQAAAFSRKAKTIDPENDLETYFNMLTRAIGNCPGSLPYNRDYLNALTKYDRSRQHWRDAARTSQWILKLSQNNKVDLDLTLKAFNLYGMYDYTVSVYEGNPARSSGKAEREYLLALFEITPIDEFRTIWDEKNIELGNDPELSLVQSALDALSQTPDLATAGLKHLDKASQTLELESKALRLRLSIARHQNDTEAFEAAFDQLEETFQSTAYDHIAYWNVLVDAGRGDEAIQGATAYNAKPRTAREVMSIGNAFYGLGLSDLAIRYLARYGNDHGFVSGAKFTQSEILIESEQWAALHSLAREIRATDGVDQAHLGFSHFLDTKAYLGEGRKSEASHAAQQLTSYSFEESHLGLYIASNLWDLGFIEATMDMVWEERTRYHSTPIFWELCFRAAVALGQGSKALIASENLYRIEPDNLLTRANYAAILLSERKDIDRALVLTHESVRGVPNSMYLRVNHAHALLLNQRLPEAVNVLEKINVKALSDDGINAYRYASLELFIALGKLKEAHNLAQNISPDRLLPGDRSRLGLLLRKLDQATLL